MNPSSTDIPVVPPSADGRPDDKQVLWFEENVHAHDGQLKAYLRGRFPYERDVDDIVQESYIRVWKAFASRPIRSVKAFLFRIAQNLVVDRQRQGKNSAQTMASTLSERDVPDETADVATIISDIEKERLLATALAALPARAHELIILCKLEGLSHREAAQRLGISERTVDEHLRRGIKRLSVELEKRGLRSFYES